LNDCHLRSIRGSHWTSVGVPVLDAAEVDMEKGVEMGSSMRQTTQLPRRGLGIRSIVRLSLRMRGRKRLQRFPSRIRFSSGAEVRKQPRFSESISLWPGTTKGHTHSILRGWNHCKSTRCHSVPLNPGAPDGHAFPSSFLTAAPQGSHRYVATGDKTLSQRHCSN